MRQADGLAVVMIMVWHAWRPGNNPLVPGEARFGSHRSLQWFSTRIEKPPVPL